MKFQPGISTKLTVVFALFAAMVVTLLGSLAYLNGYGALEEAAVAGLVVAAVEKEAALERWIAERESNLARLAASRNIVEDATMLIIGPPDAMAAQTAHNRLVGELQAWAGKDQTYLELLLIETGAGQVVAATDAGEEGTSKADRPYFIHGRNGPYTQNVYRSEAEGRPAMTTAAPLYTADGRLIGVLAARLNLDEMSAIIGWSTGLQQTDDAYLINADRLFVTPPRFLADDVVLRQSARTEAVNRCLGHESGVVAAPDYRQTPAFIVYRWLPARELCLIAKIDQAEALAPANEFGRTTVYGAILAIVVAMAVAILLARTITRPVRALQAGVNRFAQGEPPETLLPVARRDELGVLAREFHSMAHALARKEAALRDQAAHLEKTVQIRTADLSRVNAELEQLAQEQALLIQDLDAFSRSVAHDLKSPLGVILGYSELIIDAQDRIPAADVNEQLRIIYKYGRKMNSIIDELLLLAMVRMSEVKAEPLYDMGDIAGEAIRRLGFMIEKNQAEVQTPTSWPVALGYAPWIEQVWVNYLSNALKYGRRPACLKLGAVAQPEGVVCFWLENEGPEISLEAQERLFKPFSRLDQVNIEGHGLGLSIVRRIVEKLGGRVGVENVPGYGVRFSFTLPATQLKT